MLWCIFGPNLEILSWIGGEWGHGQAQNMAIFYFEVTFDFEVQGQLTPKTIGILTKVFCYCGPNLVILAWTGDKLSRGQASDYCTHRRTHRQTQATTIPKGQNWPRVIKRNRIGFNDGMYPHNMLLPLNGPEDWSVVFMERDVCWSKALQSLLTSVCSQRPNRVLVTHYFRQMKYASHHGTTLLPRISSCICCGFRIR